MKLKLMSQQLAAIKKMEGHEAFALFMEQGTGKTATLLADAESLFANGKIDAMLVVAPKGVHISWIKRELPKTLSVDYQAAFYLSGNAKAKRDVAKLFTPRFDGDPSVLKILSINYDALITKEGKETVARFLRSFVSIYAVLDESTRIKNLKSKRTIKCMALKPHTKYRRIATGTPVADSPMAVFPQMEFLEDGLLGTTSYRSFVSEYAVLLDESHHLMKHIREKNPRFGNPQVVERDEEGRPMYKNLDKLQKLLEPYSYRALKRDCLDLPPKVYETFYFELDHKHKKLYDDTKKDLRITVEDDLLTFNKLTIITKLQQITSGFIKIGDEHSDLDNKQRINALLEVVEDMPGQAIIWAKFRKEIEVIAEVLRKEGHEVVEYHGGTKAKDREIAIDSFQAGASKFFVGHQKAAGIGLTLTAAETVIYYSNDYSSEERLQSEDRAHRIGTTKTVTYIDIVALDTIDERIAEILQSKQDVASIIMGDR